MVYADIELLNGGDLFKNRMKEIPDHTVRRVRAKAMVDSGTYMLAINEETNKHLGLPTIRQEPISLADDTVVNVNVVGPVEVRFGTRSATTEAIVLPGSSEILLGAIPMEGMGVLVDPRNQRLIEGHEPMMKHRYPLK